VLTVVQEAHGDDGITAVSKGVIQRDHQHTATITGQNLFQPPNPFNRMSDDDNYKTNVEQQPPSDSGSLACCQPMIHLFIYLL